MPAHRFRYPVAATLAPGDHPALAADDAFHLVRVVRARPGQDVELVDTTGRLFDAVVDDAHPLRLRVVAASADAPPPAAPVVLVACLLGGSRFDEVVEKATELGVAAIRPVVSDKTAYRPDAEALARKRARWTRIAAAAARQSKRAGVPRLDDPVPLTVAALDPARTILCTNEAPGRPLAALLDPWPPGGGGGAAGELTLVVGPEAGFSAAELAGLAAAGIAFASLGPTVLRAETAAIAATAVAVALAPRV